jgi:predicted metalloprotease
VIRRRQQVATVLVAVVLLTVGWSVSKVLFGSSAPDASAARAVLLSGDHGGEGTDASRSASRTAPSTPISTASPTAMRVTQHGPGTFEVVPGKQSAPDNGPKAKRMTVRVEVEKDTDVDQQAFAAQVMQILNDPRSWGHGGTRTFARTDAAKADIRVILASPDTSERMCKPLETHGVESCSIGNKASLTTSLWAKATKEFGSLDVYRDYVVNHEVGHVLGHHHQQCPGKGKVAPVMQQQTIRVAPCTPNGWPFP